MTGFELLSGFIEHLQVVTTNKHNTISGFHTLQITPAHATVFNLLLDVSW
jgi:hypothetical protein